MTKIVDLTGKRFGRITVLKWLEISNNSSYWEYMCDCGVVKKATASTLNAGRLQSCGCLRNEIIGARKRKNPGDSARNRLISNYKRSAIRRKYSWELTDDQFFNLTNSNCHYCGISPTNDTRKISPHSFGHIKFNGIDRINNGLGYTIENCVSCCRNCNLAKCNFSYDEFINWIDRISQFHMNNRK